MVGHIDVQYKYCGQLKKDIQLKYMINTEV